MFFFNPILGYMSVNLFSIMIAFSSSSIMIQWLMLEVTMLTTIPFIINSGNTMASISSMKYFISQAPASSVLLFSFLFSSYMNLSLLITLALLFKMALPPFQGWLLNMLMYMSSSSFFMILSLQKFVPFMIMSTTHQHWNIVTISLMLSFFLSLFSINSVLSFPMLLFFSSLINSYWILFSLSHTSIWLEFMIFYSIFLLTLLIILSIGSFFKLNSLVSSSYSFKLIISTQLFNLAGLPPLAGFFLKLMFIKSFYSSQTTIVFLLLSATFLLMYFYIIFIYLMFSFPPNKMYELNSFSSMIIFALQSIPFLPLVFLI